MRRPFLQRILLVAIALSGWCRSANAAQTLKLGTLVPVGTSYHKILMTMADTWKRESHGAVDLRIFAGGKAGGEADMVGLMMENSLQVSVLTAVGLAEIERASTGLQYIPLAFQTYDEIKYVSDSLKPLLEKRLLDKGFVVLFWTDAGWVRLFSDKPVVHPADLKKLKLFTWAGDAEQVVVMKTAGLNPVPIETADIVPSLQTGLIDAVCMPPFFALASQVDTRAPYMLRINWSPLVGACVVRAEIWNKLPEDLRKRFKAAAEIAGQATREAAHRESDESIAAMQKRGLKVTELTPEEQAEWREMAESLYPEIRKRLVPADIFDLTMKSLAEARAKH